MKGEFYKMEYEAWDEGTDALSLEQEAAYLRLCHQMYRRRGSIPSAPATLARIWRCHPNKARKLLDDLVAAGKITERDGHLTNTRVTRELDARETRRTQQADAGHTGGTRTQENRRKPLISNEAVQADAATLAQSKSSREEKRRGEENTLIAPKGADPDRFPEFRAAYPRRSTAFPTSLARKRWIEAIRKGADPAAIVAGAKAYAAEQARIGKVGTVFIRTADVWLHQGRWADHTPSHENTDAPQRPQVEVAVWRDRVRLWRDRMGHWPWPGPPPDEHGTNVPVAVLTEFGLAEARAA